MHILNRLLEECSASDAPPKAKQYIVSLWLNFAIRLQLPQTLHMLGRTAEAASIFTRLGLTWSTVDASVDGQAFLGLTKARGVTEPSHCRWTAETIAWTTKLQYVLCTSCQEVVPDDILAALPSPDVLESYADIDHVSKSKGYQFHVRSGSGSLLLLAAEVCELLDRPADALLYLARALRVDERDPTTDMRPTTHARGHALRGRILAAQGKRAEAEKAFEKAVEVSRRTGLRLLELFALRDLKTHVLDHDGRSQDGIQRLKTLLGEMKGPPAELTKLLGEGLDADAILRGWTGDTV